MCNFYTSKVKNIGLQSVLVELISAQNTLIINKQAVKADDRKEKLTGSAV
jgi:hypothetical protein